MFLSQIQVNLFRESLFLSLPPLIFVGNPCFYPFSLSPEGFPSFYSLKSREIIPFSAILYFTPGFITRSRIEGRDKDLDLPLEFRPSGLAFPGFPRCFCSRNSLSDGFALKPLKSHKNYFGFWRQLEGNGIRT